jgi:multidrug efflux pump subunit AcrA (membrane-fusion protein)
MAGVGSKADISAKQVQIWRVTVPVITGEFPVIEEFLPVSCGRELGEKVALAQLFALANSASSARKTGKSLLNFNFTKYGLLRGDVLSVSHDAIVRDKPVDRAGEKSPGSSSSEPKGQDLSFAARVSLDRSQMQIDDKLINLTPGMAVTVEIKTGSRSVLSYLLSPLIRYGHEGLRER